MKKLTDKQKSRLWEQSRNTNFQASYSLDPAEYDLAPQRVAMMTLGPQKRGLPYLCAIHQQLYQGIADWAGKFRDMDVTHGETPFCHFAWIEKEGNTLMRCLESEGYLAGLPREAFITRLAHYYCEINVLHPFRSGNGLALRIFFEQLAIHAGYLLNWRDIDPDSWRQANQSGALGDPEPLRDIFAKVVSDAQETG